MPRLVVIGIGNPDRGDDGFGRLVASRLGGRLPSHVRLFELNGEASSILDALAEADAAILIDAAVSDGAAGEVHRFDVSDTPLPAANYGLSTHGFGLAEAVELARTLGTLPGRCIVYTAEAGSFELGAPLSAELRSAVEVVADRVLAETEQWSVAHA